MVDAVADLALVPHHADHRIWDAHVLRRLARVRPAVDLAVLAPPGGGRAVATQVGFLPGELARHDLVGLAAGAVEMEHELEAGREAALPIAGHPRPLIPDIPTQT